MKKLSLIDKAFLLKRTPLFAMLDLDLLLTIADKLGMATFDVGDTIFSVDQDAHRMYFIAKGSIRIQDKVKKPLSILTSNDFFGDESLFQDRPRTYEAVCESDAILLTLSRTSLMSIISECPSVAIGLLQAYAANVIYRGKKMVGGDV